MESSARPPKAKSEEKKKTPYVKFGEFLRKYRVPVLVVFGAGVLAVLAVAAGTAITDSALKASTARLEKLDADYQSYSSEQDTTKKAALEKALLPSIDAIVKKGPRLFAAQKALSYRAKIEEADKDWASAEKDWLAISAAAPDSYLAPIAIQGAAVAAEEQGASDRAAANYKKLIDTYASKSIGIPHAYFALGRIAEESKDYASALVSYQKIVSTWPDSDWTKLATDRIIFIKSRGLAK
jgi:tetratricopeptide (TPR) repeat protein